MTKEQREELIATAKSYSNDDYDCFEAELGWQDWMQDYCLDGDGNYHEFAELEEGQVNAINKYLQEIFIEAHS